MLGLTIIKIEIVANTNGGRFSIKIPFKKGLNIIRAENSSGKSTCVNAIAYGLGLEAILGPSRKRPFPKSLYEEIFDNKKDGKPFFVSSSFVTITIENSKGNSAILTRDIQGNDNKVSIKSDTDTGDYFLGSAGSVGSANSQKGFHHWLADFIGWNLPSVVTFDGKETKLYLECIFPLFFIEQKRGWSEIQANVPTHYGIKNVKKAAAEFCLAIDSFEHEKKIAKLKNKIDEAEVEWDKLRATAESIADFNKVRISNLVDLDKNQSVYRVDFKYLENDVYISVREQEKSLNRLLDHLTKEITSKAPDDQKLTSQIAVVNVLRREIEETTNSIEMIYISISEVDSKLQVLKHDHNQYQQLKRLKNVGGDISTNIDTQKCPICENELYDTLGNRTVKRKTMTLEENIEFLKNQLDFFNSIKKKNVIQLQGLQDKGKLLYSRIKVENDKLSHLRDDMVDINGATTSLLREKIQAEILLSNVLTLKESQDDLNEQATRIHSAWSTASNSLKLAKKGAAVTDRGLIIRKLESIIKGNLTAFNFNPSAINLVSVSHQTLRPEQEGYDIVAETSASDYIRIIWSYTLALLELAGREHSIKHGGFVVFDEPRQHEASRISFTNLIQKASITDEYGGQVIFATSLDESELTKACAEKDINLVCFDDYILTLEKDDTEAENTLTIET